MTEQAIGTRGSGEGLSRALVLGWGGVAGISWMLGVIDGLRRHGVDLAAADLVVGTSAGSCDGRVRSAPIRADGGIGAVEGRAGR